MLVVLPFAVLHRADESQPARNSCPRLPHSVDSRFGLYHVLVVLSFSTQSNQPCRNLKLFMFCLCERSVITVKDGMWEGLNSEGGVF